MKKIKRLFSLVAIFLFIVTLASCNSSTPINTTVPTSSLNLNSVVASAGDFEIKNDLYYTRLRALGYDTVYKNIRKVLFAEEYAFVQTQINFDDKLDNDYEEELFDAYASEIFGTNSPETFEDYTSEELDKYIAKYIDNSSNKGIFVTKEQCLNYVITDDKLNFVFRYIPQEVLEDKLLDIAINKAAKDALEKIVDDERIEDEDGKLVSNSNYISEDNIKVYFESTYRNYGSYQAIVIQFNNLTEARETIRKVENIVGPLTDDNALEFYVTLYNTYYNYRPHQLSLSNPFNSAAKTEFVVNEDKDELSEISSAIKSVITNTLDEDHQYLIRPFNQNNKYVMIYRGSTEYAVNKEYGFTPLNEEIDWSDLVTNDTALAEVKAIIRDKLIDNKVSSYTSKVLQKRIEEADIEIYDPYFEFRFHNNFEDYYELIAPEKFDNDNIFKVAYNNNTSTYSVVDFYTEQSRISGVSIVVDLLKYDYVYQFLDRYLDADDISSYESQIDTAIDTFNKNENNTYSSNLGESLFLLGTYGYATRDDALKYNILSSRILSSYLSESVFDEWAAVNEDGTYPDTHDIAYDKLNILENILDAGNNNYNNLFSINIDHILIYLDDDSDGSPDDPKKFLRDFSPAQKAEFETALLELANAIYNEANCEELTRSNNIMEILKYVVTAYSKNEPLFSDPTKTWADYKKYNFLLRVESLSSSGDTTQSNVNNYVKEFADYVKELYQTAKENSLVVNEDNPVFYYVKSQKDAPSSMDDICATQFGYHMIIVNDYDLPNKT